MAMRKPGSVSKAASRTTGRFVVKAIAAKKPATTVKERKPSAKALAGSILTQTAVLKKAGGSLIVTVPARARDALHLSAGQEMTVVVEGDRLVLEPAKAVRPKYSIDELIAKCDLSAPYPDEAREWIDAPAVGRELL